MVVINNFNIRVLSSVSVKIMFFILFSKLWVTSAQFRCDVYRPYSSSVPLDVRNCARDKTRTLTPYKTNYRLNYNQGKYLNKKEPVWRRKCCRDFLAISEMSPEGQSH